jgi:hypothetical protein
MMSATEQRRIVVSEVGGLRTAIPQPGARCEGHGQSGDRRANHLKHFVSGGRRDRRLRSSSCQSTSIDGGCWKHVFKSHYLFLSLLITPHFRHIVLKPFTIFQTPSVHHRNQIVIHNARCRQRTQNLVRQGLPRPHCRRER